MSNKPKHDYALTFRGEPIRNRFTRKVGWASVYTEQHAVLTYVRLPNGKISFQPVVQSIFKTAATAAKEIRCDKSLHQWQGQSFVVPLTPGVTEITDVDCLIPATPKES